ncbi:MAG TPA: OmcA/MtrC family decaheme c-type cytochrome [Desulfuromonadales bacterium]|nr:OmcA/MtrC family decaheme c-type cytochrome [Desulfuromonadales bacterium]
MIGKKLWYMVTLVALMMLPLAGCSGSGSSTTSRDGIPVTFNGKVGKTTLKSVFATADLGTLTIIDAQNGATLGSGVIDGSGSFKNVTITLPTAKATLVFKADVNLAGTPFRAIVPMDLSNPPASGITGSNTVNITISQESTNIAITTSAMLGVTGILGDPGATLNSANKTYADAAQQVVNNGGQVLSYSSAGNVQLTGSLSNAALLPAMDAAALTVADLNNVALGGDIQSTFIPTNKPIVNFTVTNKATGKGIKGLRTFALHVAKLTPELNGSNSYWMNYIASGLPQTAMPGSANAATNPTTDAADRFNTTTGAKLADGYKVIDHGDGSYTVTFGADITKNTNVAYDANATTRLGISVRSVAVPGVIGLTPGAYGGPINPLTNALQAVFTSQNTTNLIYDFIPATGAKLATPARDLVTADACAQCHYKLAFAVPNNGLSGHTGSRTDTKLCVMCHTKQVANGEGEFVTFIHRIHMGEVFNEGGSFKPVTGSLVTYNEQTYPQDIRNCTTCHKGNDSWKDKASQKACGSCHNAVDFASHHGGQPTDQNCTGCHADATLLHVAMTPPDAAFSGWNGATTIRANAGYMAVEGSIAAAEKITYDVKEVKAVATADVNFVNPSITFKLKKKDNSSVVFGDYSSTNGVRSIMPGFVGTPGVYFAFAVPQDNIAAPADYNATAGANLKNIYYTSIGKTGGSTPAVASTMTGPDATGYYTATLTTVKIPVSATMLTGGLGYQYDYPNNQPLTQMNVTGVPPYDLTTKIGGLIMAPTNVVKVATGYSGRRAIVANAKCNACHVQLGVKPQFHVGQRNDAPTCSFCHNTNRVNSGWSANLKDSIHSLHAASKRDTRFSWEVSAGAKYWAVTLPGTNASNRPVLKNCEMCHLAGMYDFSNSAYTSTTYNKGGVAVTGAPALTDRLLYSTYATGLIPLDAQFIVTGLETVPAAYYSPFVTPGANYGTGFAFSAATGAITPAADTTLVMSPITAACYSCHFSSLPRAHMIMFGGSIYEPRSSALAKKEQCLLCHGTAQNVSNVTVPTIKAIHRWW